MQIIKKLPDIKFTNKNKNNIAYKKRKEAIYLDSVIKESLIGFMA